MTEQRYDVWFARGEDMPPGRDWLFMEVDGRLFCVIREGRATRRVLREAWAGYRELVATRDDLLATAV